MYCSTCEKTRGFYRPLPTDHPAPDGDELACGACGTAVLVDPVLYASEPLLVSSAA